MAKPARIRVGVIGLGGMGNAHLRAYRRCSGAQIVAVADLSKARRDAGAKAAQQPADALTRGGGVAKVRRYEEGHDLIADVGVDLVDICAATPAHYDLAMAAIKAGKHVLLEKPVAQSSAQAKRLAIAAAGREKSLMPAMCMRFWPGWTWLKRAVESGRYGRLESASFRRLASRPPMGSFYLDSQASGGAILDLHIHDVDFILWCLGRPEWVQSSGYIGPSGGIDHVVTQYGLRDVPLVTAEGSWTMAPGFGFFMQFLVVWQRATVAYGIFPEGPLVLLRHGRREVVAVEAGDGYDHEIAYLVGQAQRGKACERVTFRDAVDAMRVVEAEKRSVACGRRVAVEF